MSSQCTDLEVSYSRGYIRIKNISKTVIKLLKLELGYSVSIFKVGQERDVREERPFTTRKITEKAVLDVVLKPGESYVCYFGEVSNVESLKVLFEKAFTYKYCEFRLEAH